MKRLAHLVTTVAAGLRSFDDLTDENDRLATSNELLRGRIIEQQARIDDLEAELATSRRLVAQLRAGQPPAGTAIGHLGRPPLWSN